MHAGAMHMQCIASPGDAARDLCQKPCHLLPPNHGACICGATRSKQSMPFFLLSFPRSFIPFLAADQRLNNDSHLWTGSLPFRVQSGWPGSRRQRIAECTADRAKSIPARSRQTHSMGLIRIELCRSLSRRTARLPRRP